MPLKLLLADFWNEPLRKIAKATGLVISLYDLEMNRVSGPHTFSPIAQRLKENFYWEEGGAGLAFDRLLMKEALKAHAFQEGTSLQMFGIGAFPAFLEDHIIGYFVIGWIPIQFADPIGSDTVAKSSNLPPMEVWQLLRMQQPMAPEKIRLYADMLQTFAGVLLTQLQNQETHREQARVLRVLNQAGMALTNANTPQEICDIAIEALRSSTPVKSASIYLFQDKGELLEMARFDDPDSLQQSHLFGITRERHLKVAITSAAKQAMGHVDLKLVDTVDETSLIPEITALTAQIAVALQKAKVIADLEKEQQALGTANISLRNLHKMKDEFLATVSHELRTPLNSILGWSQLLSDDALEPAEFKDAIEAIKRNALVQSRLIEDLLDVSRIISGKMTLQREVIDIVPILKSAIETVTPGAEARGQKIHVQVPHKPIYAKGDATRLQQIFWNILSNSVKFTPEKGSISVIVENIGPYFKVEIADTGRGIPPEFLPHLFDRFSQVDSSLSRAHGGLGLGLAIVRHLAELHGGTVSATSDGSGQGSKFVILLPQNVSDKELDMAREVVRDLDFGVDGAGRQKLKGLKILAVDDEPDSLRLIRFVLEKSGATVKAVGSAEEAFHQVSTWLPDLIVSDISMPGEDGYGLLRRIRELPRAEGGATPAFALTAHAGDRASELATNAGFQKHFAKPLDPAALLASVKEFSAII